MGIGDIIILLVTGILVFAACWKIRLNKKKGTGCPGCSGCSASASCNSGREHR